MTLSNETRKNMADIIKRLKIAIDSMGNQHHLSSWEQGQVDGLLWAIQIVKEMKDDEI